MLRHLLRSIAVVATAWGGAGCELPEIPRDVCGNGVTEPNAGEACDGPPDEPGLTCGAPGGVGACQFVCDGAGQYRCEGCCPTGQVCGLAGLCSSYTGSFEAAAEPMGGGAEELVGGDLDGDRRLDVVRLLDEELGVVFGAERRTAPNTHRQRFEPLFLPVIAKRSPLTEQDHGEDASALQERHASNLIVPRLGLALFQVGTDQSLRPISQASLPAPGGVEELGMVSVGRPGTPASERLLWHVKVEVLGGRWPILAHLDVDRLVVLALTAGPPSTLAATPLVAQLDERPDSPYEDVVLGYTGNDELEFFNPFRPDATLPRELVANECDNFPVGCPDDMPRRIDIGAPLARGPFVADLNQDGHLDLVVQVESTSAEDDCAPENDPCYQTRAAYGVGNGTFHSSRATLPTFDPEAPDGGESGDNRFGIAPTLITDGDPILALGDLDGDPVADVVTNRRISVNYDVGGVWARDTMAANPGDPWTEAVIADFNGNGLADVAATNGVSKRIYFYSGAGGGALNPFDVALAAPLTQLRAGDFDGDVILDLLGVATSFDPAEGLGQEVAVLFGSPAVGLGPPNVIGRTSHRLTLMAGRFASDLSLVVRNVGDGIDDVVAVAESEGALHSAHVFAGRSDRELRSPLGFIAGFSDDILEADYQPHMVRKVVAGRFEPPAPGQAALARPEQLAVLSRVATEVVQPFQIWLVPELHEGFNPRSIEQIVAPLEPLPGNPPARPRAVWELGMFAAVDMDGDDVDELVALAPHWDDRQRSLFRVGHRTGSGWQWLPAEGPGEVEIPTSRYAGPTTPCRDPYSYPDVTECTDIDDHRVLATDFAVPAVNGRLRVCALDAAAPGSRQLVLLSRRPCTPDEVLAGSCSADPRLFVYRFGDSLELTTGGFEPIALPSDALLYDVDCLDTDGLGGQELVVLTADGIYLVRDPLSGAPAVVELPGLSDEERVGAVRVAAGDVDGDGLDDLVVSSYACQLDELDDPTCPLRRDETRVFYAAGHAGSTEEVP